MFSGLVNIISLRRLWAARGSGLCRVENASGRVLLGYNRPGLLILQFKISKEVVPIRRRDSDEPSAGILTPNSEWATFGTCRCW
jgi:hypothetical protein